MIPYGRQEITPADIDAVVNVLRSEHLTQGPAVPRFEGAIAGHVASKFGVAMNSATSALHLACLALDLGPGDWLWTSPITFVASANCGRYCRAQIDFVDIDPVTLNMSIDCLREKLQEAKRRRAVPKVVVPVHFSGEPCEMESIAQLADQYGFRVIEDASHAVGAKYKGGFVGNCQYSSVTVFSFHPVKIITTAEGGLATTNDPALAKKMALLRSHGITRSPECMTQPPDGDWYYQQIDLGFNYRMTDIQAALGLSQLTRLEEYISRRQEIATRYDVLLKDLPLDTPYRNFKNRSALHLYPIQVHDANRRKPIFDSLRANGIGANVHYIPVNTQPDFAKIVPPSCHCPNALNYYARAISLPMYASLSDEQLGIVVNVLTEACH